MSQSHAIKSPSSSHPKSPTLYRTRSHLPRIRLNRTRTYTYNETDALLSAQHDEEEFADSDGLYPPNCTWTSHERQPDAADPYGIADLNVYENLHRYV
jgi:hypothetical protein